MYNYFKNCENISSLLLDIDRTSNVLCLCYILSPIMQIHVFSLRPTHHYLLYKWPHNCAAAAINRYYRNIFTFSGQIFNHYYWNIFPFSRQILIVITEIYFLSQEKYLIGITEICFLSQDKCLIGITEVYFLSQDKYSIVTTEIYFLSQDKYSIGITEYVSFLETNSQLVLQK